MDERGRTLINKTVSKKNMSLTSLIQSDKVLRNKILDVFQRPKLEKPRPLLAPFHTTNYSLVGVAFDYLLRFYLEKLNGLGMDHKNQWVAEKGIKRLEIDSASEMDRRRRQKTRCRYKKGLQIINNVKSLRKEFAETAQISRELIRQTLRMSYIDPVLRSGRGIEYIGVDADTADIEDIERQLSLIDDKLFIAKDRCLLNPTFGGASRLVGGADADLIIDDKLIDIKATKKLELSPDYFCQLIGYLLLYKIYSMELSELITGYRLHAAFQKKWEIKQLGIYYSRYGYLFLFKVRNLLDDNSLQKFTEWFENYVRERH